MATSGSFNTSAVGSFYFTFEWHRTGYSSSANEHYIHWTLYAHNTPGNYRTVYLKNLWAGGSQKLNESSGKQYYDGNVVASGDITVSSYNNEGDGNFSASFEAGVGINSGSNCSGNGSWNLDRIPRYANLTSLSVQSRTHNSITLKYTTDRSARIYINLNNGQSWLNGGNPFVSNTTSGTITIRYKDRASTQRLDPNTTYNITVLCRNNSVDLDTSKNISATTYDIAKISSLPDFEHGDNASVSITNPAGISSLNLAMKIAGIQILSRTVATGSNIIEFSDEELDSLYKKYGSSSNLTATFVLTGSGCTNSKTCVITLKGNQKTININQLQTWKRGKMWIYILSDWLRCVIWKKKNGIWKRGI